jgi:enamine deaminase RidA (YjgF/YER057c/UK114 family)
MPTARNLSSSFRTRWWLRFTLNISLCAAAPLLGIAQTAPTRFDTYESRLAMLALMQTLKHIIGRTLGEQTRQALRNVQAAVEAAGGTPKDIVALRIYIVQHAQANLGEVGDALREVFTTNPPASTWIGVSFLAVPDFLVEIEAIAALE